MRRALALGALLLAGACQLDPYPAPILGSTYRISEDKWDPESEILIDILTTDEECAVAKINDVATCRPKVDRANAEVHLSFVFRDRTSTQTVPMSLTAEQLVVSHARSEQRDMTVIPHAPRGASQLYVVIIDASGSMHETIGDGSQTRMDRVEKALLSKTVVDAFFPDDQSTTGVVPLIFSDTLRSIDGGEPRVILNRKRYRQLVREHLNVRRGGYTHLYSAVREGMTDLLLKDEIKDFLNTRAAQATVIVLTDGFNNELGSDTCATNAPRLEATLGVIRKARARGSLIQPILYTVGLGKPYRQGEKPEGLNQSVTATKLCAGYADARIDGLLEREGIDHVSLSWLAEAGGGVSYVRQTSRDLASVFAQAAAKRYEWFEVRYRVPGSLWHRQGFTTRLQLTQGYRAGSEVQIHPHPWLDGPTATADKAAPDGSRWMRLTPLRHSLSVLMPILGGLVLLSFLGAALFNASRAIFRRARPRR